MTHKFALSDLVIFTVLMHQTEFSKIFWGLCPWTRPHWGLRHQTPATVPSVMQAPPWSCSLTEHSARFACRGPRPQSAGGPLIPLLRHCKPSHSPGFSKLKNPGGNLPPQNRHFFKSGRNRGDHFFHPKNDWCALVVTSVMTQVLF